MTHDDFEWVEHRRGEPPRPDPSCDRPPADDLPVDRGLPSAHAHAERSVYAQRGGEWRRVDEPSRARRRRTGKGDDDTGGRKLLPAGFVLLIMLVAFGLAALLNIHDLVKSAETLPLGAKRSFALALTKPVKAISSLLQLDHPREYVDRALGRSDQELADVHHRDNPHGSATPTASSSPSPGVSSSPDAAWVPSKDDKLALWVGGDSMAMIFGESLVAMCDSAEVIDSVLDYRVSTGLSRPEVFDWPARLRAEMASFSPNVAVAMFGANDGQDVEYQGEVLKMGTPEWVALYHERVGAAMDILVGTQHRQVWWVGMPISRLSVYNVNLKIMNKVYAEEAKKRPDVHWFDIYLLFADKNGNYAEYLNDTLMRQGDGIHFSRAGADRAAQPVLDQIKQYYHIQ